MISRIKMNKHSKLLLVATSALLIVGCSGSRPIDIGVTDGTLTPCPSSPNCVSSFADTDDETHYIEALPLSASSQQDSWNLLRKTISENDSANIITDEENYIYAEYTSSLMRYVDDAEFLLNTDKNVIDVRSASRLGYRDFDANRDRIEAIREQLKKHKSQ